MNFRLPAPVIDTAKAAFAAITPRRAALAFAVLAALLVISFGTTCAVLYQQLPQLGLLTDYNPKQPLRVFTSDGIEIGQFGAERRYRLPIASMPKLIQDAVVSVEDARFREHSGVDLRGVLRAALANLLRGERSQGGSTITQQVARTFYLSSRKSYTRKLREALLAIKIERHLSKDQILELYLNQIYLGQRAYGFEAASQTYFGKPLTQLSVAETAMLAGLPQNPNHANPVASPERARYRQLQVLERMHSTGVIGDVQWTAARDEPLHIRRDSEVALHAEYVAEMARQTVFAQYGEQAYSLGLKVYTSLRSDDQRAARAALRHGMLDYERRQVWRGPEDEEDVPAGATADDPAVAHLLADNQDDDDLRVAVVTEATPRGIVATLATGEVLHIGPDGLRLVQPGLSAHAKAELRVTRGSVIRVLREERRDGVHWVVSQWPEAEGALVAMDPHTGEIRAMVGGFDFAQNQFNHATQAWRQPGSSFKPFLYSAALEHGVMPATKINDAPLPAEAGGEAGWDPQNSDHKFDGPLSLREALAKSKNLVTIRLVQLLGTEAARQWAARFGFDLAKQPDNLTLALGSGATTPLELASAYSVFANGGHRVQPLLIERVVDAQGKLLFEAKPAELQESDRVIPLRNAFLMQSLLQEVTRSGTAAKAQTILKRPDVYGKTGTTNEAVDAWFAGFQPNLAAVVWMGYDTPRSLGEGESGGGLSLPVWIEFMQHALKDEPVREPVAPEGVVKVDGDWRYSDVAESAVRLDEPSGAASAPRP